MGNGGTTDKYVWTQTLQELNMRIPIESNVKSKEIKVAISVSHLSVYIKGDKYIDADFPEKVNVDDSLWTIESEEGQRVINLAI